VTISRSAYPNRLDQEQCLNRFKGLKEKGQITKATETKEALDELMTPILKHLEEDGKKCFAIGKSKIYFKAGALEHLEGERMAVAGRWAVEIQKVIRGWIDRRKLVMIRFMALVPQAIQIQCWVRALVAKKELKRRKKRAKMFKKMKKKQGKASIKLQARARGMITRKRVEALFEDSRMKQKLKEDKKKLEDELREKEMERMKEVEAAKETAQKEIEDVKARVEAERKVMKETIKDQNRRQAMIDESSKILEYLRKENLKLRAQNDTMKKEVKSMKENNMRLMEANASASASFQSLNDHAKELNKTNKKTIKILEGYKQELLQLKNDLKERQKGYLAEAEARLAYQKEMSKIIGHIQDRCRDAQIVEDVVILALECEACAKAARAALETKEIKSSVPSKRALKAAPAKVAPKPGAAPAKKAPARRAVDSDSDSDSDDSD